MPTTRRNFFRNAASGVAAAAALPPVAEFVFSEFVPASRASEPGGPIILSRNENAYGPSQKVIASMQDALQFANRYPDPAVNALHERIAQSHSIKPEQLVLGCGSGEILSITASSFLGPGKTLITAVPTFESIGRCAKALGAQVVEIPLDKNFSHDLPAMLARADASTALVYICNPNNPTASLTPRKDLEEFIRKLPPSTTVLIDEAYHHFVGATPEYTSFIRQTRERHDRIIVARTFSKVFRPRRNPRRLCRWRPGKNPISLHPPSSRRPQRGWCPRRSRCTYDDHEYVQLSEKHQRRRSP